MSKRPDIDQARLRPHLRQPMTITQPDNGINYVPTFNGPGMAKPKNQNSSAKALIGEPGDLRGIPVVGAKGVGGVSPGTQPERATVGRHGDWTARREEAA